METASLRRGEELLFEVVRELVDDLVDCSDLTTQAIECLPDEPTREVVAAVLVEVLAAVDFGVVTVGGERGKNHVLLLHDADVVAGVLELAEPFQHRHVIGEIEVGQLPHQYVVLPLHLLLALLGFTRRLLAFGRIAIRFGAPFSFPAVVGNDVVGIAVGSRRELDVVELRLHGVLRSPRQLDHPPSGFADHLTTQ